MSLTAAERSTRARIGAFALHAQGKTNVAPALAGQLAGFVRRAIEEAAARGESLTPEEASRRAAFLRRQHMAALSLRASQARRRRQSASSQPCAGGIVGLGGPASTPGPVR